MRINDDDAAGDVIFERWVALKITRTTSYACHREGASKGHTRALFSLQKRTLRASRFRPPPPPPPFGGHHVFGMPKYLGRAPYYVQSCVAHILYMYQWFSNFAQRPKVRDLRCYYLEKMFGPRNTRAEWTVRWQPPYTVCLGEKFENHCRNTIIILLRCIYLQRIREPLTCLGNKYSKTAHYKLANRSYLNSTTTCSNGYNDV